MGWPPKFNNHQKLQQVRDELARCLVEEGDYCGAETMLRCTLATTCLRYGDTSVEYSNELLKFTDILEAKLNSDLKVDTRELVKLLVKAKNIFQMQYGDTFSQVQEIQGKLNFFSKAWHCEGGIRNHQATFVNINHRVI